MWLQGVGRQRTRPHLLSSSGPPSVSITRGIDECVCLAAFAQQSASLALGCGMPGGSQDCCSELSGSDVHSVQPLGLGGCVCQRAKLLQPRC